MSSARHKCSKWWFVQQKMCRYSMWMNETNFLEMSQCYEECSKCSKCKHWLHFIHFGWMLQSFQYASEDSCTADKLRGCAISATHLACRSQVDDCQPSWKPWPGCIFGRQGPQSAVWICLVHCQAMTRVGKLFTSLQHGFQMVSKCCEQLHYIDISRLDVMATWCWLSAAKMFFAV